MASGSGSAPASGSESPPARREGLLPRRESLWLGEGRVRVGVILRQAQDEFMVSLSNHPPPLHPVR